MVLILGILEWRCWKDQTGRANLGCVRHPCAQVATNHALNTRSAAFITDNKSLKNTIVSYHHLFVSIHRSLCRRSWRRRIPTLAYIAISQGTTSLLNRTRLVRTRVVSPLPVSLALLSVRHPRTRDPATHRRFQRLLVPLSH